MVVSLKMAALCLDASLETLQPLCCRRTPRIQGDLRLLWRFRHAMSSKRAHSLLSRGLRSALPESQFSVLMKACRFLRSHSWIVLALWSGTESCWKTHSWPLKRVMLRCFTAPCSMSSWYIWTPVSPLSCKNEDVSPPDETPPTNHDIGRVMAYLHPQIIFLHLMGHLNINLILLVVLLLDGEDFLIYEEDVSVPALSLLLEETLCSCSSHRLQSRSKNLSLWAAVHSHVLIVPDDALYWSGQYVQLSGHDLLFPERILANPLPYCLIAAWAIKQMNMCNFIYVCRVYIC